MKGHRIQEVFDNITNKLDQNIPLEKEDFIPLMLCPLMSGDIQQKDRILQGFQILRQAENTFNDVAKMEAVLYAMASKFLEQSDLNQIKEEIKMTALGLSIYNDGKIEEAINNARKFLKNGAPYDLVRASIEILSDEKLQSIYDEVMEEKETE